MNLIMENAINKESLLRRRGLNGKINVADDSPSLSKVEDRNLGKNAFNITELNNTTKHTLIPTRTMFSNRNNLTSTTTTHTRTTTRPPAFIIKRSLSESSADEVNRSSDTTTRNACTSRKMFQNELSINPNSCNKQPMMTTSQRRQRQRYNNDELSDSIETNKQEKYKKNHFISDMIDVGIRITLVLLFIKLETTAAFQRNIHVEELWLYKNPRTVDFVSPQVLIISVIVCPFVIAFVHFLLTRDRRDFRAANWTWTLCLCLNGITTSLIKITAGRPRPDFFYRCFPDGQMMANVTPTAVNFNCTGNWRVINEGYKSFPSGHASFAFCSYGFIAFYLAGKLHSFNTTGRGESWRLFPAIIPLWIAALVGISRTCDYHHHWQDVVVGGFIGIVVAYLTYRQYYPSIFSRFSHRPLPRDGGLNNFNHGYRKMEYARLKNDEIQYENDIVESFNTNDDQLPLICDEDNE